MLRSAPDQVRQLVGVELRGSGDPCVFVRDVGDLDRRLHHEVVPAAHVEVATDREQRRPGPVGEGDGPGRKRCPLVEELYLNASPRQIAIGDESDGPTIPQPLDQLLRGDADLDRR